MSDITWLESVCYTYREPRHPFGVRIADRDWACATQGHTLTLVLHSPLLPPDPEKVVVSNIEKALKRGPDHCSIPWCQLQAFIAGVNECEVCHGDAPPIVECPECEDGTIECSHCQHESDCLACKGNGYTGGCPACIRAAETPACGYIGEVAINRRLLIRALGPLAAETVDVYSGEKLGPVQFVTRDWTVVVMPLSKHGEGPRL